jgi:hypothetical protein
MASTVPKEVKKELIDSWLAETGWKVALFTSVSDCLTRSLYSACSNEVSAVGTGYTTGGATVTRRAWGAGSGYVDAVNAMIDANDVAWSSATFTCRYAVVYETTGSKIRGIYDLGSDLSVSSGTFTIVWNAGGLAKVA